MRAPPVHEEPDCTLHRWIVAGVHCLFFLVGYYADLITLRRSTPIVATDVKNLSCRTQSGRHYQLLQPHATNAEVPYLLNYFLASMGVKAVDATQALQGDPELLYTSFLLLNDAGDMQPAKSRLEEMSKAPLKWLRDFADTLAKSDVAPSLLKKPLRLSEVEWQLFKAKKLASVSIETAFRARILREMIEYTAEFDEMNSVLSHERPYPYVSQLRQQITELLMLTEMHALLEAYRPCQRLRGLLSMGRQGFLNTFQSARSK